MNRVCKREKFRFVVDMARVPEALEETIPVLSKIVDAEASLVKAPVLACLAVSNQYCEREKVPRP